MKKIKILRIITRLNIGGPAIHTALLTKELNDNEFESVLMHGPVSKGEGNMGYISQLFNIKPVYVPQLRRDINPFLDIPALWRIFLYIKRYKPDIVHTHMAKAGALGRIAAILAKVPVKLHTFHGNIFDGYFGKMATKFFIFIERLLAKFTDGIVVISRAQEEDIVKKYRITNPEKCKTIKLGFDLGRFLDSGHKKNVFRKRFNFKEDDILVGIVGRLTPIKNHKMFINASRYVTGHTELDVTNRIKFIIAGDGELKNELSNYARLNGLEKKILFTGWFEEMEALYADLDIFALTSLNEGTPVAIIEAMACSKPIVATDVGGIRDATGGIGFLVKIDDYKAMGDIILDLSRSAEKREEAGRQGKDFVRDNYSKERLVSELEELYRNLLGRERT